MKKVIIILLSAVLTSCDCESSDDVEKLKIRCDELELLIMQKEKECYLRSMDSQELMKLHLKNQHGMFKNNP